MSLSDLYTQVILEHYKQPHNLGKLDDADIVQKGYNESCGDDIRLYLKVNDGIIEGVTFEGKGCAISQASASMMTERIRGMRLDDAMRELEDFKKMISGDGEFPETDEYFELAALKGVIKFPIRVKCATLAWNTLKGGLKEYEEKKHDHTHPHPDQPEH